MALDEIHFHMDMEEISKMKMLNNNVLVEVFDNRGKVGSVIVPITSENPFIPDRGIAFKTSDNTCFDVGDHVIIEKYKGRRVFSDDGRQFILLNLNHVIAKITN